jgi:hypothetical protein
LPKPLLLDAEHRHGHHHAQRERRRRGERTGRWFVAGNDGAQAGRGDEQEKRAQKAEIFLRVRQPDLLDLFRDEGDDDLQQVLPAGAFMIRGEFARDEFGPDASTSIRPR